MGDYAVISAGFDSHKNNHPEQKLDIDPKKIIGNENAQKQAELGWEKDPEVKYTKKSMPKKKETLLDLDQDLLLDERLFEAN